VHDYRKGRRPGIAFLAHQKGIESGKTFLNLHKENFMPEEFVTLKLPKNFVGQMLDGLRIRAESWEHTKIYLSDGVVVDPDNPYVEECNDETEAGQIEAFYREIIKEIETQLEAQSK
jgi:hypothetical protein